MIVVREIYELNSSGVEFRAFLSSNLHEMGYEPSRAENNMWMQPAVKPDKFEF